MRKVVVVTFFTLFGLTHAAAQMPAVPQAPLAKGSIKSILPAVEGAYSCGLDALRLETGNDGLVRLYVGATNAPESAYKCAEKWVEDNAQKFNLTTGY
jgi:hypothetical protein